MKTTRNSSPARSQGQTRNSIGKKPRRTRSVGSPATSNASGRLTAVMEGYKDKNDPFSLSILAGRKSVLTDNTDIEDEPRRKSWWKKLNEKSQDVMEILEDNNIVEPNNIMEELDIEVLSQEKKNYTVEMPESSDNESINSIVLPQRKLFTQKENHQQKKFSEIMGNRDTLAKVNKNNTVTDKSIHAGTRELFQNKKRSKPIFPSALLNISPEKTLGDKTKEFAAAEPKGHVRTLFGHRAGQKRKNMFANFIVSESEDEIPEIQPKVFSFPKKSLPQRRGSSQSRGLRESSPASVTTDIEMDEWKHLPSSTMVEHQLEAMFEGMNSPVKKTRLSNLSETKESEASNKSKANKSTTKNTSVTRSKSKVISKENEKELTLALNKSHEKDQSQSVNKSTKGNKSKNKSALKNQSKVATEEVINKSNSNKNTSNNSIKSISKHTSALSKSKSTDDKDKSAQDNTEDNSENIEEQNEVNVSQLNESNNEGNESQQEINQSHEEDNEDQEASEAQPDTTKEEVETSQEIDESENEEEEAVNDSQDDVDGEQEQSNEGQKDDSGSEAEDDQEPVNENEEMEQSQEALNASNNEIEEKDEDQEADENVVDQSQEQNDSDNEGEQSQEVVDQSQEEEAVNEEADECQEAEVESEEAQNSSDNEVNESQDVVEESQEIGEEENKEDESEEAERSKEINESEEAERSQEVNESEEAERSQEVNESDEIERSQEVDKNEEETDEEAQNESQEANESEQESENDDDGNAELHNEEMEVDNNEVPENNEDQNHETTKQSESLQNSANISHDTTGRYRNKDESPDLPRHEKTNQNESFSGRGRNTSIRKTTMIKNLNIRPSMAPPRESIGFSDGTNSSAEGSGWDSHGTTRKTIRQTFGKDASIRKSLRTLVMEKSAKRQTLANKEPSETAKFPLANSTELPEMSNHMDYEEQEPTHEVSLRTKQTTLEAYLQKIKKDSLERKAKMEEAVRNTIETHTANHFKVPQRPLPRRPLKTINKVQKQPVLKDIPEELIDDLQYKPPKRFRPTNAPWITNRLYKFLENKLEPKYDYKARVRSEKLVETIYQFTKELRRQKIAPKDSVDVLKHEMARLDIVKSHFEFYEFFHQFMPREVRIKVIPDVVNKIPLPRRGVFSDIVVGKPSQG